LSLEDGTFWANRNENAQVVRYNQDQLKIIFAWLIFCFIIWPTERSGKSGWEI
jgi:hypothetical protein